MRRLLPGLWAGLLLCIALLAAPSGFAVLERPAAGRLVGRMFAHEAAFSLGCAVVLLLLERARARAAAAAGQGSQFSAPMLLVLLAVASTVAGYYALQPLMEAARAGTGPLSFGQLHAISVVFFGIKTLAVLGLAWLATQPAAAGPLSPAGAS